MSPPTAVRPAQPQQARSLLSQLRPAHVLVALGAMASVVLLTRLLDGPDVIERISFRNPTEYDLSIETAGHDRDGWLAITTARREAITVVEEVVDIGEVWVFRFSAQGESGGELRLTRAQLASNEWLVPIPKSVGAQLQAAGAPPSSS